MNFEILKRSHTRLSQDKLDALVVLWPDQLGDEDQQAPLAALAQQARAHGDFPDRVGSVLTLYAQPGFKARAVVLVAVGKGQGRDARRAMQAAMQALSAMDPKQLGVHLAGDVSASVIEPVVMAVADASYRYTHTVSDAKPRQLRSVSLSMAQPQAAHKAALAQAQALVQGVGFAREWANRPANHATPSHLADAARSLAKMPGVQCKVLGPAEVKKLGMGSFMAVAQGSQEPLRFIELRYQGGKARQAPVVLVGKGITFDTGGISLKPAPEMDEMKYDMSGAASVLGVFRALAELKPAINVVGLIPATENMPGGRAIKTGDVVTSMSGQTIEILNTDAEGRLVLCDALTYAERFKPAAVIDIATLTGACMIALGGVHSGLFASDDALAQGLLQAGTDSGDTCWRMPLDDDYAEGLKTRYADVANVGGRPAGAVTAAKFLQRFAKAYPWAHLDIAGTAWKGGAAKGATGRPVPLLMHYLLAQAKASR